MAKLLNFKKIERGLKVENKSESTAEIVIYDQIGKDFWSGEGLSAKDFDLKLKSLPSTVKNINIRLTSPGGDVFEGLAIYNRIKQHKAFVTVYIDGLAASIASIIALAGDKVVIGEGALMMIHKASTMVWGNSDDMIKTIEVLDEIDEQLVSIYYNKCGKKNRITRAEIKSMMTDTTWFNAEEAMDFGLVDETMTQEEKLDIAACLGGCKWIKKMPEIEDRSKEVKNKINELNKNISEFLAR